MNCSHTSTHRERESRRLPRTGFFCDSIIACAKRFVAVAMLAAAPARAFTDEAFVEMPIETLVETAPTQHPAALFVLASRLFADERGQEAAGWMYAGQLRYRFMLIADDADPGSADATLFSALMEQVGRPVNNTSAATSTNGSPRSTGRWIGTPRTTTPPPRRPSTPPNWRKCAPGWRNCAR